jgi:translation initiation factor 4E
MSATKESAAAEDQKNVAVVPAEEAAATANKDSKDAAAASKEHPLETPWTFYFDKKLPSANTRQGATSEPSFAHYQQNLQKLGSFSTFEGFWRHYAYLHRPEEIPKDHDLFLVRSTFIPAWESFPNGGCWIIKVRKRNGVINRLWEELLCAVVSELFEEPDVVVVELSTRLKDDALSVWNRDNTRPEIRFKIGEKLKEILNLDESTKVEYKPFSLALRDGSTYRNARPYMYAVQYAQYDKQNPNMGGQQQQQQQNMHYQQQLQLHLQQQQQQQQYQQQQYQYAPPQQQIQQQTPQQNVQQLQHVQQQQPTQTATPTSASTPATAPVVVTMQQQDKSTKP